MWSREIDADLVHRAARRHSADLRVRRGRPFAREKAIEDNTTSNWLPHPHTHTRHVCTLPAFHVPAKGGYSRVQPVLEPATNLKPGTKSKTWGGGPSLHPPATSPCVQGRCELCARPSERGRRARCARPAAPAGDGRAAAGAQSNRRRCRGVGRLGAALLLGLGLRVLLRLLDQLLGRRRAWLGLGLG